MTILSPTRTTPNFNPRTPRGVRRGPSGSRTAGGNISIHAPRAGRDVIILRIRIEQSAFQSTRPVRGATCTKQSRTFDLHISIHAPRAGRDAASHAWSMGPANFNPRAPCGARLSRCVFPSLDVYFNPRAPCGARPPPESPRRFTRIFQSTRPVRGATTAALPDGS